MKKALVSIFALFCTMNIALAERVLVKVTPAKLITTTKKYSLSEGDYVDFKTTEDTKAFRKGEIITGVVTSLDENGFSAKEAQVLIEHFRSKDKILEGEIYLRGGLHKKLGEFVEGNMNSASVLIRGGEVIARPDEQEFLLYTEVK